MLTTKTFATLPGASRDDAVIIPAERVAAHRRCRTLWEEANVQADTIVAQAHEHARTLCEQAVENAEATFWQQANALLQGIRQDREHLEQTMVTQAGQLLRDALAHLLDKTPAPSRYHALLRQLLKQQQGEIRGTLYCHPAQLTDVQHWLDGHPHLEWRLASDEMLDNDAMKLITAHGVMSLSWRRAAQLLIPPDHAAAM
ncbi:MULTISPECIES: type III secretion system stator protein SctL [Brenneria]|uniref:HrpE/YscL family type III secretion apparatus protein n=1 Tax=Brenneria nigrifluens DSM 30175 = ATCC 13028 TaxID=1121120 RepID=A0A2U1UIC1_9GAMM|nr:MULTISPECIES: type III secretion system stator protein SctL [Brenneria]EHD21261.1 type III secretion apparatus protein, HrpE/YscL family [Brenneria sp. EniD312]PWC21419.1 HrpE/YscL family type III secretion apparatus protein [Brenneria nigrifluens DSM 30175 = ATCC 13028]QCR04400.1 HrpE/YscL family type III secretion apparatus protein [Brenneria nigrifluens DSM 30175 = ATCC 13028]